jgi:hypothetical protein
MESVASVKVDQGHPKAIEFPEALLEAAGVRSLANTEGLAADGESGPSSSSSASFLPLSVRSMSIFCFNPKVHPPHD